MAIYELNAIGLCYGQQMVNRFYYMSGSPGPVINGSQELVDEFHTEVLIPIRVMQKAGLTEVEWQTITARDLYDASDFGELVNLNETGLNASPSQSVSPFTAVAFRSPRYLTGRNRAYKRFAGIPEGQISGNDYIDAVSQAGVEAALILPLVGAVSTATFTPQLLFLEEFPVDSGNYRLYTTEAAQRANAAVLTQMDYIRLTTQRSRIAGHGA